MYGHSRANASAASRVLFRVPRAGLHQAAVPMQSAEIAVRMRPRYVPAMTRSNVSDGNPYLPQTPTDARHRFAVGYSRCLLCGAFDGSPASDGPCRGGFAENQLDRVAAQERWCREQIVLNGPTVALVEAYAARRGVTWRDGQQHTTEDGNVALLRCGHTRQLDDEQYELVYWAKVSEIACLVPGCSGDDARADGTAVKGLARNVVEAARQQAEGAVIDGGRQVHLRDPEMREYRKRPVVVTAHRQAESFEVPVEWQDTPLVGRPGDWLVSHEGHQWPVANDVFDLTYERVSRASYEEYAVKVGVVYAVQMTAPFTVRTIEGLAAGLAGDYLAQGVLGEAWPIESITFERSYVPAV
jgi:hypothetical protein